MSDWRFELAQSSTMERIGELFPVQNRSLTMTLDRGGEFSFSIALEEELALEIKEVITCVLIWRRGADNRFSLVWSGPIWRTEATTPNTMSVTCVGWIQTLEKRVLVTDVPLITADGGFIALILLDAINDISASIGAPIYVTSGSYVPTVTRSRSYKKYEDYLNILQGLSDIEDGIDYSVDPSTRELNIYDMNGSIRPELSFEYGNNISSVNRSIDTSRLCNKLTAIGAANTIAQQANNLESQVQYGIFEEVANISDVKSDTILAAYAEAEVAVRAYPLKIYSFATYQSSTGSITPRAFEDFFIGDIGYLTVSKGPLNVRKQAVRVFNFTLAFDDNGNELPIQIQTTDQ